MDSRTSIHCRCRDLQYSLVVDRIREQPYDGLTFDVTDDQIASIEYLFPFDGFDPNRVYHTGWLPVLEGIKFVVHWVQTPIRCHITLSTQSQLALRTDPDCYLLLLNMHEAQLGGMADIARSATQQGIALDKIIVLGSNPSVPPVLEGMHQIWVDNFWEALCRKHHRTQSSAVVHPADYNEYAIDRKFLSLNRNIKSHRLQWMYAMQTTGILQQGYVSWHLEKMRADPYYEQCMQISGIPEDTRFIGLELDELPGHVISNTTDIREYYKRSAFSIITESDNKIPFVTEKTFKAIACMHPFFIVGDNSIHELLRSKGYYTFEEYFQTDSADGVQEMISLAEYIRSTPVEEFVALTQQHHEQLVHNYRTYFAGRVDWTDIITQVIQRCN